jgi:hypothetical protein
MPWRLTTEQLEVPDYWANAPMENLLGAPWNNHWTPEPTLPGWLDEMNSTMPRTQESNGEVLSLFAECVGPSVSSDSTDYRENISSHLEGLTIEMYDNKLVNNVKKLTGPSKMESAIQLVRYSVYLSSNNLLPDWKTDKLLMWMTRSGTEWILDFVMDLKAPTTEIFGSHVLVSAARLGFTDIIRSLIAKGVDVNAPAGQILLTTAL